MQFVDCSKADGVGLNFPAHYNAAPGQDLPVIRLHPETGHRVLGLLRWGLIPYWSKDPKIAWRCINARGETVKTTSAFRSAYQSRRCLVPADAFYAWKASGASQPNELVAPLHDRMPVILAPEDYARWLSTEHDPADLIRPYPADQMITWPVSTRVNTPKNDDAEILDRVQPSA
jgi:putative SOS response-associated peptidase YedK